MQQLHNSDRRRDRWAVAETGGQVTETGGHALARGGDYGGHSSVVPGPLDAQDLVGSGCMAAHHSLRQLAEHAETGGQARLQDTWGTFRDPEAEATFHGRGFRTRPAIRRGEGPGCNTTGLRAACHTLWLCPCGCGSLVPRVEAIKAARAAGRQRFTDGDGNAARAHARHFHRGRFTERLAERGAALLAGSALLIRRPDSTDAKGAWLVSSRETARVACAAIALAAQLRGDEAAGSEAACTSGDARGASFGRQNRVQG